MLSIAIRWLITGAGLLAIVSGCASVPQRAQQYENFSDYAESVFRHQNALISRMMMLNEADQLPDNDALDDGEQAMHDACHLLNEYAEMESDGEIISPFFTQKVQNSIEGCDNSIDKLESLLNRLTASKHSSTQ